MVSYYHQVYPLTALRECLFPLTLPWCRTTTKSTHSLSSLTHTHSPIHVIPVNTSMVSYYHQVYPLTALRELVLPLTLPWCRTTTKCTLTLSSLSHTLPWCRTTTKSSHTHTNPCAPTHSHLPCPHTLCSPHFISPHSLYKCITNSSQLISHTLPPIMPPSHHHHLITSSYHQPPPITTNRFLSIHTTLLTPPFHSQPSQSSPKSSPISIHTHSSPRRTPWTTQQHQTNSIKKMG